MRWVILFCAFISFLLAAVGVNRAMMRSGSARAWVLALLVTP